MFAAGCPRGRRGCGPGRRQRNVRRVQGAHHAAGGRCRGGGAGNRPRQPRLERATARSRRGWPSRRPASSAGLTMNEFIRFEIDWIAPAIDGRHRPPGRSPPISTVVQPGPGDEWRAVTRQTRQASGHRHGSIRPLCLAVRGSARFIMELDFMPDFESSAGVGSCFLASGGVFGRGRVCAAPGAGRAAGVDH